MEMSSPVSERSIPPGSLVALLASLGYTLDGDGVDEAEVEQNNSRLGGGADADDARFSNADGGRRTDSCGRGMGSPCRGCARCCSAAQ
ncbi:hypothetical protein NQZ68_040422 [Dissostichus eleginoides]|nr:hypothetical protein NQZ68_040422 [Dissostichus eleginoides]